MPDLIVSEKGAIAVKTSTSYRFYRCSEGRAAVVLVSGILNAVTTETARLGVVGDQATALAASLGKAVDLHSKFLRAEKLPAELEDLPI